MFKKFTSIAVGAVLLASPLIASAETNDLQAQVDALLAQVKQLMARVTQLQGGQTTALCVDVSRNLTLGSTGDDVTRLQNYLNTKNVFSSTATGYYGFVTAQAVGRLQLSLGIVSSAEDTAYGILGPKTRTAIACGEDKPIVPIISSYCPSGQVYSSDGSCSETNSGTSVTGMVKCVFNGATTEQKCWGDAPAASVGANPTRYTCSGNNTCVVTVTGKKGVPMTWGSSCGGSADTRIDGSNNYAYFSCATTTPQPNVSDTVYEKVKCVFSGAMTEQKCYAAVEAGSAMSEYKCYGTGACVVDVAGRRGTSMTWKSSCGGTANTMIGGNTYANFVCSTPAQPTATIDQSSVGTVAISTVLTGNAANLSSVVISLTSSSGQTYNLGSAPVTNGRWSKSTLVSNGNGTSSALPMDTYTVFVRDDNKNLLASGTFTVVPVN